MTSNLQLIVSAAVCVGVAFFLYRRLRASSDFTAIRAVEERARAESAAAQPQRRGFTIEELAQYRGDGGGPVYVGVMGRVFSVDPRFYGPDAPYHAFAGREATIPLATMAISSDRSNIADPLALLSESERETAEQWLKKFEEKYDEVGWFVPPGPKASL